MASLEQFNRRIKVRASKIVKNTDLAVRATAGAVDQAAVLGTPVDKGIARSNWIVTVGVPTDRVIPAYAPGSRLGIGEQANAAQALSQAQTALNRPRQPGTDVFIQNNVDYIERLNAGSSRQAPANFVELAVLAGLATARRRRLID